MEARSKLRALRVSLFIIFYLLSFICKILKGFCLCISTPGRILY